MTLSLPPSAGTAREGAILDRVLAGTFEVRWATLTSQHQGHEAEFEVFADALKIDGVRVNVSADTQQKIADVLGCFLLTPKLADLLWAQRGVTLPPFPRPITSSTTAMIEHSAKIDAALSQLPPTEGILATVGKHWVLDNALASKPGRAMNYGWHFEGAAYQNIKGEVCASLLKEPSGSYTRLIQGRGTAHDRYHVDYSQTCVLVARTARVDGQPMDLSELLTNSELAPLASHQGPLVLLRQPGVDVVRGEGIEPSIA